MDETRLLRASLRDGEEQAHAQRGAAGPIENLDGEPGFARPRGGGVGERGRRHRAGGLVDEIACARDGARGGTRAGDGALTVGGGDRARRPQDPRRRRGRAAAFVGEVLVEAVAAEQRTFGRDLARARAVRDRGRPGERGARGADARRDTRRAAGRDPQRLSGSVRARAETDERDALRAQVAHVHHQRLPELAAKPLLAGRASQHAADAPVRALEQAAAFELCLAEREHEQIGFDVGGLCGRDGEVEHGGRAEGGMQRA